MDECSSCEDGRWTGCINFYGGYDCVPGFQLNAFYKGALQQTGAPPCEIKPPEADQAGASGVITASLTLLDFNATVVADETAKTLFLADLRSMFAIRMNTSADQIEVLNFRLEESGETLRRLVESRKSGTPKSVALFDLSCKGSDAVSKMEGLRSKFVANVTDPGGGLGFFGSIGMLDTGLQFSCPAGHVIDTTKSYCVKVGCIHHTLH